MGVLAVVVRCESMKMTLRAISLKDANAFVESLHRHHKKVQGHKFSLAAIVDGVIVGVCIVGRPVARLLDTGRHVEVTRLCTDGTKNACSFLYGAAARAAQALGYESIGTYILESEPGTSLIASGWRFKYATGGGTWDRPNRSRSDKHPTVPKKLFVKTFYRPE
jgi:hypothetical protein